MSSEAVNKHKVATILKCMEDGLSPDETAQIFRKQAEIINACCDNVIQNMHEKTALVRDWLPNLSTTKNLGKTGLLLAATAPIAVGYFGGMGAGQVAAKSLTPVNELPVSDYQKAEELLRTRGETANILARVEEQKKKEKQRARDRSVRALF